MSTVEEPRDNPEWRDDAARGLSPPDVTVRRLEEEVRTLVRGRRSGKTAELTTSSPAADVLAIGMDSIADIEKLMGELLIARDYLQSEGERVREANARYVHLAQTASASVKTIAESLGKWRNVETTAIEAAASLPQAPTLAPVHDDELRHESNGH
jgi:hypothetical protein